jgi:hypothetical protein
VLNLGIDATMEFLVDDIDTPDQLDQPIGTMQKSMDDGGTGLSPPASEVELDQPVMVDVRHRFHRHLARYICALW